MRKWINSIRFIGLMCLSLCAATAGIEEAKSQPQEKKVEIFTSKNNLPNKIDAAGYGQLVLVKVMEQVSFKGLTGFMLIRDKKKPIWDVVVHAYKSDRTLFCTRLEREKYSTLIKKFDSIPLLKDSNNWAQKSIYTKEKLKNDLDLKKYNSSFKDGFPELSASVESIDDVIEKNLGKCTEEIKWNEAKKQFSNYLVKSESSSDNIKSETSELELYIEELEEEMISLQKEIQEGKKIITTKENIIIDFKGQVKNLKEKINDVVQQHQNPSANLVYFDLKNSYRAVLIVIATLLLIVIILYYSMKSIINKNFGKTLEILNVVNENTTEVRTVIDGGEKIRQFDKSQTFIASDKQDTLLSEDRAVSDNKVIEEDAIEKESMSVLLKELRLLLPETKPFLEWSKENIQKLETYYAESHSSFNRFFSDFKHAIDRSIKDLSILETTKLKDSFPDLFSNAISFQQEVDSFNGSMQYFQDVPHDFFEKKVNFLDVKNADITGKEAFSKIDKPMRFVTYFVVNSTKLLNESIQGIDNLNSQNKKLSESKEKLGKQFERVEFKLASIKKKELLRYGFLVDGSSDGVEIWEQYESTAGCNIEFSHRLTSLKLFLKEFSSEYIPEYYYPCGIDTILKKLEDKNDYQDNFSGDEKYIKKMLLKDWDFYMDKIFRAVLLLKTYWPDELDTKLARELSHTRNVICYTLWRYDIAPHRLELLDKSVVDGERITSDSRTPLEEVVKGSKRIREMVMLRRAQESHIYCDVSVWGFDVDDRLQTPSQLIVKAPGDGW